MKTNLIPLPLKLFLLGLFTACSTGSQKQNTNENDEKYSGEQFNEHVRTTEARSPEEQRLGFRLPPGFEIELYASEPEIGKPINMAFDAKGRLWVTQSFEYPFAAKPGQGSDRISILEDTNGDGKADRFTHFADTLNIPIGILPVHDGAIAYSIPHLYHFTDQNGDGKADFSQKLLGPFEHRDTHGMVNNLIRGYDGWVHACHGFTNRSTIAGTDGDSITMVSGNTFRFRPDGSRVEHTTHGRINPFGLAYDELGYLYSTDCHTSPLYQLIRDGHYTQWGKEDDMGFAPDMKPLEDEATALAGIAYYADTHFPEEYQSNFYIGDVVASRVYRNSFKFEGASPVGKKEPDFILSEDPWFRPVDVKLGPDGALYIADFYNRIIGHYEVPLDHPLRDKTSGRIWRVTYKGGHNKPEDLTKAPVDKLVNFLGHENLALRMAAADQLADRVGEDAIPPLLKVLENKGTSPREYIHALWVLHRLDGLSKETLQKAAVHPEPLVRVHTLRILKELGPDKKAFFPLADQLLDDGEPHVQRAAVELMAGYADMGSLKRTLAFCKSVPNYDSHLRYTTRLSLREQLVQGDLMAKVLESDWDTEDQMNLADVMTGVPLPEAGVFLTNFVKNHTVDPGKLLLVFQHIARFVPQNQLGTAIQQARENHVKDISEEYLVFKGVQQGLAKRGAKETEGLKQWGATLATKLLEKYPPEMALENNTDKDKQKFAIAIAGDYQVSSLSPHLQNYLKEGAAAGQEVQMAALKALLKLDLGQNLAIAQNILYNASAPNELRKGVATILGDFPGKGNQQTFGWGQPCPTRPASGHCHVPSQYGRRKGYAF